MATRSHPKKNSTIYEEKYNSQKELCYQTYEVGRALGKGGFAHVYQIKQRNRSEVDAVKMISKLDKQGKQDAMYLQKIRSEIKIMQVACQDSDKMVKYLHSFSDNDYVYIIMELCPLGSLNDMVKRRKTLTESQVRYFVLQMIHILLGLREKKIIHRDIKLANLFVTSNYKLKLGDFGLATFYNEEFRNKRGVCGTPNYIAPEVIEKKEYAFQVDLWATGVIMFTMLLGVPPFQTKSCKQTYDKIKSCSFKFQGIQKNIKISEEAKMLIRDILVHDPKQRITPSQMLNHPFLTYFPIPPALQPQCYKSYPSYNFLKKFSSPIVKAQPSEQAIKPQNNETTLQKKERNKPKQIYRNIKLDSRKGQEVKNSRSKVTANQQESVKEQNGVKTQTSRLSKLETSISIKNRQNSQREEILPPNKKFKNNVQRIHQNSERDLTSTMVKQPMNVSSEYLSVELNLADKNLLNIINKKHYIMLKQRQTPKVKPQTVEKFDYGANVGQVQRVVWYQISKEKGLVYQLSGGNVGAIFSEGSKILLSNISKIEYAQKTQVRRNGNELTNSLCLSDQVQYLNELFLKRSLKDCERRPQSGKEDIFIKGYLQLQETTIFNLSNQDLQFVFEDGCSILARQRNQHLIYQHHSDQILINLPIDASSYNDSYIYQKVYRTFSLLQKVGLSVMVKKEWNAGQRWKQGVGERLEDKGEGQEALEFRRSVVF